MNILLYTTTSPYSTVAVGGAETSLKLIAEQCAARGHRVLFVTYTPVKSKFGYRKLHQNGVEVYEFQRYRWNILNRYKPRLVTNLFRDRLIKKILRIHAIDIVHTYYNLEACKYFLTLREHFNFKLVIRVAGLKPFDEINKHPDLLEPYRNVFAKADLLNFISKGLYDEYLKRHEIFSVKSTPYFIKDIGVAMDAIGDQKKPTTSAMFEIIMVSRFTAYAKRQDLLVEAMHLLPHDTPIRLTLVGDGPNLTVINKKIEDLGLSQKITIVPYMDQTTLWDTLKEKDLLCHACDHEGLSKIVIESLALGIPVLVSDVTPLNTYIKDEVNGFLVENTPEAWSKKLLNILERKNNLTLIIENGIQFVHDHYAAKHTVNTYIEQFNALLKS